MPVVVPCPKCSAKLKAPDNLAGKKVKCKACGTSFHIPGVPVADSIGEADIPVADLIDDGPPVPLAKPTPAAPAKPVTALPSADAFDFSKPKPSAPVPAPAPRPAVAAPKPAAPVPVAKAAAPVAPPKPAAAAPAAPKPASAPAPAAKPAPKPVEPPAPESEPTPVADAVDDMFAFGNEPPAPKKGRRDEGEEDDEDDRPRAKKRRDEEDEDEDEDDAPKKSKGKAAATESYNPFADYPVEPEPEPEKKPKARKGDDEDEPEKPRYLRPEEQGSGTGKAIMLTGVIGAVALLLGLAATVVYIKNNRKPPEEEAEVKKDAAPAAPAAAPAADAPKGPAPIPDPPRPAIPDPPRPDPKGKDKIDPPKVDPPKVDPKIDPKGKDKVDPPKVDAVPKPKDPGPKRAAAKLPGGLLPLALAPPPKAPAKGAKDEFTDTPRKRTLMKTPVAEVVRAFPPIDDRTADMYVLTRTGPAGRGEKLALDTYGTNGNPVPSGRIAYDGDGDGAPIADVLATADMPDKTRFLAASGGKLHVWNVVDKKKLADGVDPYAGTPHAAAGLAAAFLTADPNLVVTISTAGAVHLIDLAARKPVSEFVPPHGAPGRVALGLSAAKDDGNGSVAVAVGGIVYQLEAKPGLNVLRKLDLGGDVGRSLGLAVSGNPGRLLYAFESAADGKKEKAVLNVPLVAPKKGEYIMYRVPDALGDPKGAVWAGAFGGLILGNGVVWFDDRENRFLPALATLPPVPYLYAGTDAALWYVASLANGSESGLMPMEVPFADFTDPVKAFPAQIRVYRITPNGLAK